eukprot:365525-Chlamydomonas_euryale.AAC.14
MLSVARRLPTQTASPASLPAGSPPAPLPFQPLPLHLCVKHPRPTCPPLPTSQPASSVPPCSALIGCAQQRVTPDRPLALHMQTVLNGRSVMMHREAQTTTPPHASA